MVRRRNSKQLKLLVITVLVLVGVTYWRGVKISHEQIPLESQESAEEEKAHLYLNYNDVRDEKDDVIHQNVHGDVNNEFVENDVHDERKDDIHQDVQGDVNDEFVKNDVLDDERSDNIHQDIQSDVNDEFVENDVRDERKANYIHQDIQGDVNDEIEEDKRPMETKDTSVHLDHMDSAGHRASNGSNDTQLETHTDPEHSRSLDVTGPHKTDAPFRKPFLNAIASVAKDNVVILAIVDSGFLDMTINLFLSSIKPLGISNFIILATDDAACPQLVKVGVTCVMYKNFNFSQEASVYGSKEFNAKMSIRSQIMIEILSEGFTVLHTDTDFYFYRNPLDHIHCPRETCHMAALYDAIVYNAGFVLLHPNNYSISLYKDMMELQKKKPLMAEQSRFNAVIKRYQAQSPGFSFVKLPNDAFRCGTFFNHHNFIDTAKPCPKCVVVHNNWIKGMHEKILRAKEMQQWMYDKNGYYSSTSNRYMTYENPKPSNQSDPVTEQLRNLGRALEIGFLLNRTVILPKFYLKGKQCPLLQIASIASLDKMFGDAYREHSFLLHPLVPEAVKHNSRGPVTIGDNLQRGINDSLILQQFKGETASVLHFGTLDYDVSFSNATLTEELRLRINAALGINMTSGHEMENI